MQIARLHSWDVDPKEARAIQESLAGRVDVSTPLGPYETIAAADVSFNKFEPWLYAAVVVVRAGTFEVVERVGVTAEARFPYVPGLLSFREAPAVLDAFEKLRTRPDVVICDGQGIAHPRRLGLASHLGLWLGLPTVGCAKSLLCGRYDEPGPDRGDRSPLVDRGEVVGMVVRSARGSSRSSSRRATSATSRGPSRWSWPPRTSTGCLCRAGWPTSSSTRFDARPTPEARSPGDPSTSRAVDGGPPSG